jgi:hypothetical protein
MLGDNTDIDSSRRAVSSSEGGTPVKISSRNPSN